MRSLLICNSSSHSSLNVNDLELLGLVAALYLYKPRISQVVRACAVNELHQ